MPEKHSLNLDQIRELKDKKSPLYYHYPEQLEPQEAYLELDEDGVLSADFNGEIGNAVPAKVYHARTLRITIPYNLTGKGLNELVDDNLQALEKIHAGHSVEWDGNNNSGKLDETAQQALDELVYEISQLDYDEYECVTIHEAAGWYENEAQTLKDAELAAMDDDALRQLAEQWDGASETNADGPTVIAGTLEYLEELRDEAAERLED